MNRFELALPKKLDEAVALLPSARGPAGHTDARILAGGQDLLTEMKDRLVEPERLVALSAIPGLDAIDADDRGLRLGALVRLAELERDAHVREHYAVLAEAAESIASPQIRTQATVGGNLCQRPRCWYYRHSEAPCIKKGGSECFAYGGRNKYSAILGGGPSYIVHPSDLAPALVCLGASVVISTGRREGSLPLERFFTLPTEGSVLRENVLKANEVLVRVELDRRGPSWRSTYLKFRERDSFDFALASVALAIDVDGDRITEASLVLGGVAPIPWRARKAEDFLSGQPHTPTTWKRAADLALEGAEPLEENGYKVPLAKGLIQKAFAKLS